MSDPTRRDQDAIIGVVFRRSLWIGGLGGAAIGGILLARSLLGPGSSPTVDETTVEAPQVDREPAPEVTDAAMPFTDMAEAWGVGFQRDDGARGGKLLPETVGGGVAIVDLNGDGRPELVFIDGGDLTDASPGDRVVIYANRDDGDGATMFDRVVEGVPKIPGHGMGIAAGDVDGDRDVDLYISMLGRDRLLLNESSLDQIRFRDGTDEFGLSDDEAWSTAVGFGDFDGDSDLDLVGLRYVEWSPEADAAVDFRLDGIGRAYGPPIGFAGTKPFLLLNDTTEGRRRFVEVGGERGLTQLNPETDVDEGKGLGLAIIDLDDDGDLDLIGANDTTPNAVWFNDGTGYFEERGRRVGVAFDRSGSATGAMGIDVANRPSRGGVDTLVAIGNFANEPSSLFVRRAGESTFFDDAAGEGISGPSRRSLTFGLLFTDLDLDGIEDLVQANGHLEEEIQRVQASQRYRQPAQVFRGISSNEGVGFREVPSAATGDLARPVVGRALASGDLDLDGDLDLVITQVAGPPLVLRNDATGFESVQVRLDGPDGNPRGIGSVLTASVGDRRMIRRIMPTRSYLSQVEPVAVFGLGPALAIDRLEIRWPDGEVTTVEGPIEPGRHRFAR
ncbi:MAG: FG-GAP-like repeat-containing protein [Phycisphaerales bacterium]|nr:FG-GAP-like repeat-containing protein [Phycisphaerales bacterium]